MAFNQIEYINNYSKENYKTLLIKYRKDSFIYDWLEKQNNKNGYILKLIQDDINTNANTINKLSRKIVKDEEQKELYFGDWLDEFYRSSKQLKQLMIDKEPLYINSDKVFMCYLAATVEFLCHKYRLTTPIWVNSDKYMYKGIYYAGNTKIREYKKYLKDTSPIEFSKRNLFVGDNILKRK